MMDDEKIAAIRESLRTDYSEPKYPNGAPAWGYLGRREEAVDRVIGQWLRDLDPPIIFPHIDEPRTYAARVRVVTTNRWTLFKAFLRGRFDGPWSIPDEEWYP